MNWLIRVAYRRFDTDEHIVAAAIWANNKLYTGPMHLLAIQKALRDGALFRDENGHLDSRTGDHNLDLFVTNKGQILTRLQADEYFGITCSEDMQEQHSPIAVEAQNKKAGIFNKLKNPLMVGLIGAGTMLNPNPADAKHKHKQPIKQVSPQTQQSQPVNIDIWIDKVIKQESAGNPKARSNKGARGLMQIMPKTWTEITTKLYGKPLSFDKADDPEICRKVGTYYLKWIQSYLRGKMGKEPTIQQILAAYNGGIGALQKANWNVNRMPRESVDYANKITRK